MMTKILFDCERLKYPNTGLYTFCKDLGDALLKYAPENLQVTPYLPQNSEGIFGKTVPYLIQKSWHKLFVPGSDQFSVWHSSNQVSRYYPASGNTKILLTIHDLNFLIEKKDRPLKIKKTLRQIQKRIDRASMIVCISNFVAQQVKENFNLEGKTIQVIYNGCTIPDYPDFNDPAYLPRKPFLFSIGTVLPKKNFHVLPALLQQNDYELIIAGNISSAEYSAVIMEQAEKLGVSDRVKILGPVSVEERSWYYKHCLAFAFPSIAEGFGLPVIEAMHYGKPVFLSTHTSLPEIGGDAAYYFENFEPAQMQAVLKEGLENFAVSDMEQKTRERAAIFNWGHTARRYLKLYASLVVEAEI